MPDHVHLVLTPFEDEDGLISLPEILQEIKSVSAHRINKYLGRKGSLWQQESFDRAMREVENTLGKLEYVLGNPVRAGLVNDPFDYRWLWTASTGGAAAAPKTRVNYGATGATPEISSTSFSTSPSPRPRLSATIQRFDSSASRIAGCGPST